MTKEELEKKFLGKRVHVVIRDAYHPMKGDGIVTHIDDMCTIFGTRGGLGVILSEDSIEIF